MNYDPGTKWICQHDDWWNAHGDKSEALHRGMRTTLKESYRLGGATFLIFEETPDKNGYPSTGFVPLRALN